MMENLQIYMYKNRIGGNEYLTFLAPKVFSIKFLITTSTQSTRESREKWNQFSLAVEKDS